MPSFVHLHLHTEYSLVDGLVGVKPLVKAARKAGMPAVAITDQCNLFALVRFYKAALAAGIKPIAGADLWVKNPADPNKPHRLVLLVQDKQGYGNLTRLISRAYVEGQHLGVPQVERDWIAAAPQGLIALSGGPQGDVAPALLAGNRTGAEYLLDHWLAVFGDRYYLELIRTGREQEAELVEQCVDLALAKGVPVVATNDVRFLDREDFEAHEVRVCIHEGRTLDDPRRPRIYSEEQYLRTPAEMVELFADCPEALENSVEIAKRCNLELELGKNYLPDFPVPAGHDHRRASSAPSPRQGLDRRFERGLLRARHGSGGAPPALRRAPGPGTRRHLPDGLPRLLPDRRGLHRLGQAQRHPGGARARLGRRLAGRLCARDHRSGPHPARSAVRALPEPRARLHARLRRRLLHGGPRPGDRLCGRALWARGGVPDHHLRHHGRQGGGARRGPGHGPPLRLRRPGGQDGPLRTGHDPGEGADRQRGPQGRL